MGAFLDRPYDLLALLRGTTGGRKRRHVAHALGQISGGVHQRLGANGDLVAEDGGDLVRGPCNRHSAATRPGKWFRTTPYRSPPPHTATRPRQLESVHPVLLRPSKLPPSLSSSGKCCRIRPVVTGATTGRLRTQPACCAVQLFKCATCSIGPADLIAGRLGAPELCSGATVTLAPVRPGDVAGNTHEWAYCNLTTQRLHLC